MAKLNMAASNADDYASLTTSGIQFFSLKDDGNSCKARFLYEKLSDVNGYTVHAIDIDGKKKYVACLREYGDPVDACPLCSNKLSNNDFVIWLPMYIVDTGKVVLWQRSLGFFQKVIQPLMGEFGEPFCGNIFKITRHGKAGDSDTRYDFTHISSDDTILENFDDIPSPEGVLVYNKTFEELTNYVNTGLFTSSAPNDGVIGSRSRRTGARDDVPQRFTGRPPVNPIV